MRRSQIFIQLILLATLVSLPVSYFLLPSLYAGTGSTRVIEVKMRQFGFIPERIYLRVGDKVVFKVTSLDVTHGFYIDGFNIKESVLPGETKEIGPIEFNQPGKFKLRCATPCGPLHPFMVADIVVEPDYPIYIFFGAVAVVAIATVAYILAKPPRGELLGVSLDREIDLLEVRGIGSLLKRFLRWRGYHFLVILPNLAVFMLIFVAGTIGNPMGAFNFSIAVVWILWFALVEFMILFGSRLWCGVCPIPALGEWIARRRLVGVHEPRKWLSLNKKWPKRLNNMWIPALSFLGISLIVPWLVTRPAVTVLLFLVLIILGVVLYLVSPPRNFCRSICPAGGYIGYHSLSSILAVRSKDPSVCDKCVVKSCVRGSPRSYGCPWKLYPGGNKWNIYCGLDFECLKSCPVNNMTLKLRMIGKDLAQRIRMKADEAWMGFIRFGLALFYEMVFFGPYAWIKDWGNMLNVYGANLLTLYLLTPTLEGFISWLKWAGIVSLTCLLLIPAVFLVFSWLAKIAAGARKESTKKVFLAFSYALSPYGLLIWIAFALTLLGINWAYPIRVFSDPLGLGWNLLGTADINWQPFMPTIWPYVQMSITLFGLALAINITYSIAMNLFKDHGKAIRATAVMSIFHVGAALFFAMVLMG